MTISIPDDLRQAMESAARAEGKTVQEMFEEAARRMLKVKSFRSFVAENRKHAEAMGLTESDVPRLIASCAKSSSFQKIE